MTDWRGVFTGLALLTLGVAAAVYWVVPEKAAPEGDLKFSEQIRGTKRVFASLVFWRIAPLTTLSQATFLSIQGLWAGPWLRDVAGFDRSNVAGTLFLVATAMVTGFVFLGAVAERLSRHGVRPISVAVIGMSLFMLVLLLLVLELVSAAVMLWVCFGFFGTSGILPYAVLSQSFPSHLSGRVNTALNLLVFVVAFTAQWGIGSVIEIWPVTEDGRYAPEGYKNAFTVMFAAQGLAWLWYMAAGVIQRRRRDS